MEYPIHVYKSPGANSFDGATYDWKQCNSDEELELLREDGWRLTRSDAIGATKHGKKVADVQTKVVDENAPPTRQELEQKAQELGISVDGRWSDKKLADKVAEAISGME